MVSVLLVFSSSCCPCCCVGVGLSLPWILTPLCLTSLWCCSADTWSPAIQGEEGLGRVLGVVWILDSEDRCGGWVLGSILYHLSAASEAAIDSLDMVLVTISAQVQRGWDQCGSLHTELSQGYCWDHQT